MRGGGRGRPLSGANGSNRPPRAALAQPPLRLRAAPLPPTRWAWRRRARAGIGPMPRDVRQAGSPQAAAVGSPQWGRPCEGGRFPRSGGGGDVLLLLCPRQGFLGVLLRPVGLEGSKGNNALCYLTWLSIEQIHGLRPLCSPGSLKLRCAGEGGCHYPVEVYP